MKVARDVMIECPVLLKDDHATKARKILRDDRFREVYIQDAKRKPIGYIDITDVLEITTTKSNVTVEGFLKDPTVVGADDPLEKVAVSIRDAMTDSAAVIDASGAMLGGVLLSEILPILVTRREFRGKVADVMSRKVVTCQPDDHVQKIYALIVDSGFTAFPVIKDKVPIGMVSRRDILSAGRVRKALEGGATNKAEKVAANTKVETLMTTPVITVSSSDAIGTAADRLVRYDISRMPVLEKNQLVGIVDRHDVLKGMIV